MMGKESLNWGAFIEANRFWIGGFLLAAALVSGGLLLFTENRNQQSVNNKIGMLENRIAEMEVKIDTVKTANANVEMPSVTSAQTVSVAPTPEPKVAGATASTKLTEAGGLINLNAATAEQLDALPGIGPTYAKRIVEYRETHGGFKSIDEVKNVQGIGDKTFEKFKNKITIN